MTPPRLLGKVAVVTGGAGGIGESIVRSFVRHGAKVCIADVRDDDACCRLGAPDANVAYCRCDVAVEDDVRRAVEPAVGRHGGLDIMVNNAGVAGSFSNIRDADVSDLGRVMDVNVKGVFLGIKHAARAMVPRGTGSIVSTCSITGVAGGGPHAYTASKHAVLGLMRSATAELGQHGVRVNCVSPYCIVTGLAAALVPEGRRGGAGEAEILAASDRAIVDGANLKGVALTTNDVASDEAKYVSGMNLVVDGGVTAVTNAFHDFGH